MTIAYEIQLAPGWFMDNNGEVRPYPTAGVPLFKLENAIPFNLKETSEILSAFARLNPDSNTEHLHSDFTEFTLSDETAKFLISFGFVNGIAAAATGVYAGIMIAGHVSGLIKEGTEELEKKLYAIRDELKAFIKSESLLQFIQRISDINSQIGILFNNIESYTHEYSSTHPNTSILRSRLETISHSEDAALVLARKAIDPATYLRPIDLSEYAWSVNGPLVWCTTEPLYPEPVRISQGQLFFDHRFAVPIAMYAVQAYLQVIKMKFPEYRTTGRLSGHLRDLANKSIELSNAVRYKSMAYYNYEYTDFYSKPFSGRPERPSMFYSPGMDAPRYLSSYEFNVGAIDLVSYSDAYLRSQPVSETEYQDAIHLRAPIRRGELRMLWDPIMPGEEYDNPARDKMAAAIEATRIGEQAYDRLLVISGYYQLENQIRLLRLLSAEPDKSETLDGQSSFYRQFADAKKVLVQSRKPFNLDPFTMTGWLSRQSVNVRTRVTTQPVDRTEPVSYKIYLRSLSIKTIASIGQDPLYSSVYNTEYVEDENNPGFVRLQVHMNRTQIKDELLLVSSTSPDKTMDIKGSWHAKLDTYDFYVEEEEESSMLIDPAIETRLFHRQISQLTQNPGSSIYKPWKPASSNGQKMDPDLAGERRWIKEEAVTIDWRIHWEGSKLMVTMDSDATNRSCMIFVVIEELLPSEQSLHTFFPIPLHTQKTLVPERFFIAEKEMYDQSAKKYMDHTTADTNRDFGSDPHPSFSPADTFKRRRSEDAFFAAHYLDRQIFAARVPEHSNVMIRNVVENYIRSSDSVIAPGTLARPTDIKVPKEAKSF